MQGCVWSAIPEWLPARSFLHSFPLQSASTKTNQNLICKFSPISNNPICILVERRTLMKWSETLKLYMLQKKVNFPDLTWTELSVAPWQTSSTRMHAFRPPDCTNGGLGVCNSVVLHQCGCHSLTEKETTPMLPPVWNMVFLRLYVSLISRCHFETAITRTRGTLKTHASFQR